MTVSQEEKQESSRVNRFSEQGNDLDKDLKGYDNIL